MKTCILFDIGGTNTRVGISTGGKKIDKTEIIPTPQKFEEGIEIIGKIAAKLADGKPIEKICGGIAGVLNSDHKSLFYSPNLLGWIGKPLAEELGRAVNSGAAAILENDAALAGLGEAMNGAGQGFNSIVYLTISTGVGGARIINGKIDHRLYGFEPGQQLVDFGEGMKHLEDYISGSAIEKRFGKKAENFPADDRLWDEIADGLAVGLYNSIVHWSPEIVILGGSLMEKISIPKVENKLKSLLTFFPTLPIIKKAELGNESALYGALNLK